MPAHVANKVEHSGPNLWVRMHNKFLDVFVGLNGVDILINILGVS